MYNEDMNASLHLEIMLRNILKLKCSYQNICNGDFNEAKYRLNTAKYNNFRTKGAQKA